MYDNISARISKGPDGLVGTYPINDKFSELNQKMDAKIGQEQFDKSVELIRSDIKSVGDKLEHDIVEYKSVTIREMNSCLETISTKLSANIDKVSHDLEKHIEYFSDYKTEQEEFNKDAVNAIGSIYNAFKVVAFILGLNMASILAIVIYICTM